MYTCPQCEDYHTAKDWNEATMNFYRAIAPRGESIRITTLEESITRNIEAEFVCPSCEHDVFAYEIEFHPESYTDNDSAISLLQKEW
jgi:hypothetical protein